LPHFVTSKLFKVIFIDFFAKNQKLRNSVFERRTLFFSKINKYSFRGAQPSYGATVLGNIEPPPVSGRIFKLKSVEILAFPIPTKVQEIFELNQLKSAPSQLLPGFPGFDRLQTCCHSFGPANILLFFPSAS
jgi:hypothetical protein